MSYTKNMSGWWEDLTEGVQEGLGIDDDPNSGSQPPSGPQYDPGSQTPARSASGGIPILYLGIAALIILFLFKKK